MQNALRFWENDSASMLNYIRLEKIDSTNSYALSLLNEAAKNGGVRSLEKTVVVAQEQSAGRGRIKREFFSPPKTGLYFTAIYAPLLPIEDSAKLTVLAALAVCRAIQKLFGISPSIKWVNDIYIDGKKICGILAEGHFDSRSQKIDAAAIGIGINILAKNFPEEIQKKAGAIFQDERQISEIDSLKEKLLSEVCENLYSMYDAASENPAAYKEALCEYKSRSLLIGRRVRVFPLVGGENSFFANVIDIDSAARLVVRTDDGKTLALESGEVSTEISE